MTKKNRVIGFVGYSPASVNSGIPLIKKFEKGDYVVKKFILSDYAKEKWGNGIETKRLIKDDIKGLDILFYNTGSGHEKETNIPVICKEVGVISIHIMDIFWSNLEGYRRRFQHIPDYTTVVTEKNKTDIVELTGMSENQVLVLGNPHFDRLSDFKIGIRKGNKHVSFLSQCDTGGTYTEPTSKECKTSLKILKRMLDLGEIEALKVYRHPREMMDFFLKHDIEVERTNEFKDIINTDILVSCGSTPHYEANMLGVNTIMCDENLRENILGRKYDGRLIENMSFDSTEKTYDWTQSLLNW